MGPQGPAGPTGPTGLQGPAGSADAWARTGNAGTIAGTNFLGTTDEVALEIKAGNRRALRLEPKASGPNLVGGSHENAALFGAEAATIAGGGLLGFPNFVLDSAGTIGGGARNQVGDGAGSNGDRAFATVGGGFGNVASGYASVVGGGRQNVAAGQFSVIAGGDANFTADYSAAVGDHNRVTGAYTSIAGGLNNQALGWWTIIGGGQDHVASGFYATIAGGRANIAAGDYSFTSGYKALNDNAAHDGVFLFADATDLSTGGRAFNSLTANEFAVRASGGFRLRTSGDLSTGCNLPAGSGVFACTSDRDQKQDFSEVDTHVVLTRLAAMPITTWSYKTEAGNVRHMGPTAQDFRTAFELGTDDKTIGHIDAAGVALAAIQGLYRELREKEAQLVAIKAALDQRDADLAEVKASQARIGEVLARQSALLEARLDRVEKSAHLPIVRSVRFDSPAQ